MNYISGTRMKKATKQKYIKFSIPSPTSVSKNKKRKDHALIFFFDIEYFRM